ncbi:MAG TPA: DUF2993 domain-containing protein [Propionicimonas sp.]|jgi:hypothetical protein|uniref:LmeA family phospholipid-binding protein n=1 Tax=Propionicimonas sp. TaxID=1955623 RepID=UPI002F4203DB
MRKALTWTVAVLALLGAAYVGDTMLRGYVENRVADAISAEFGESAGAPSVGLGGFPFMVSLITRSVPQAHIGVDTLPLEVSGHTVELANAVADTGEISLGADTVSVATLTGSATLSYADLSRIADLPVTYAEDGRLQLRYEMDVFSSKISLAVSALPDLDVDKQVIGLTDPKFNVNGDPIDVGVTQEQLDALVKPIPVKLDHGLLLTSITPREDGVAVGVEGTNLTLPIP